MEKPLDFGSNLEHVILMVRIRVGLGFQLGWGTTMLRL